ncbi:hypothetical protein M0R45_013032 [Rubus argutus]|uniref:Uncharacterized protein n=1 Tax=Rubus argutus TaxID=59490 RepID=A0AAW1XIF5_RUBAR
MGFKDMHLFNLSLLAKQGWRLLKSPDSLVARFFKARYYPSSNFMKAETLPDMSYTWRSILAGREVLAKGTRFQIGKGDTVSIWEDPWLPRPYKFKPFSQPIDGTENWKVSDIIDHENHAWLDTIVAELFSASEADMVLKIPLSLRNHDDRLIWHYDRLGLFNVKSGYHVARLFKTMDTPTSSSSSNNSTINHLWGRIWRSRVPPKVRAFIWRLLQGILPTRVALSKRFPLPDISCCYCNHQVESELHLFKHCDALRWFWDSTPFTSKICDTIGNNIQEWTFNVFTSLLIPQSELFLMCLWAIWSQRNNIIWNGDSFNPKFMATWTAKILEDYQAVHPLIPKNKKRTHAHWDPPPIGRLKINLDGAYRAVTASGGIGVVVRNDVGQCLATLQRSLLFLSSAFHAEAEACRAALLIANAQGWDELLVETDCSILVAALTRPGEDYSDIGWIIGDCKDLINSFKSISIRHVYREANVVAHRLAHNASFSFVDELLFDEIPSIIEDALVEDFCTHNRGFGVTSPSGCT